LAKLCISIVQYLNTAPLVWGFTNGPLKGKYDLSFTVPSQCAEALRSGAADIAIIPAIEYQRIEDLVVLQDLAIASKERVRSLLLIAKKPIDQVSRIALDQSSRSTQALTCILCAEHWKIRPELFETSPDVREMLEHADAAMLIGDPALRISIVAEGEAHPGLNGQIICQAATLGITGEEILYVYDLVGEWKRFTGLPAVLAIWAARRDMATPEVAADFSASRDFGMEHIAAISLEAARELELPAQALESYLRENIDFTLDTENQRGLELYFQKAAQLGLIGEAKPIEWAQRKPEGLHVSARQ
jgi:chorismate dehydratase